MLLRDLQRAEVLNRKEYGHFKCKGFRKGEGRSTAERGEGLNKAVLSLREIWVIKGSSRNGTRIGCIYMCN